MVEVKNRVVNLKMFIDGEWKDAENQQTRPVINPANGEVISYAPEGTAADARAAIYAARRAFEEGVWSGIPAQERATYLLKIADKIDAYADELTQLETLDNGKPLREAGFDVGDAAACFRYYAGLITKPDGQTY